MSHHDFFYFVLYFRHIWYESRRPTTLHIWVGSLLGIVNSESKKIVQKKCLYIWLIAGLLSLKAKIQSFITLTPQIWGIYPQNHAGFNEHQGLRQKICRNARDTASLCGQILSCCFDLIVYILKCKQKDQNNNKNWEFAHIAWLCPWRLYKFFV